jgi:hypothetical protein
MRIVRGRGRPTVLVPPLRAHHRRRRWLRRAARLFGFLALVGFVVVLAPTLPRLYAFDLPMLLSLDRSYAMVLVIAAGLLLALVRERLGGVIMLAGAVAWVGLGPPGDVPSPVALGLVAAVAVVSFCFIWIGDGSR